jgi:hypothetical protein
MEETDTPNETNAGTLGAYIIAKVKMLRPTVALPGRSATIRAAETRR